MCREDCVLMNHISITVSPTDSLKQGSDGTLEILMERQKGMQMGLIAVWWLRVSQSQHIALRYPQVDQFPVLYTQGFLIV